MRPTPIITAASLLAGIAVLTTLPSNAQDSKSPSTPINLQSSTPGTPQIGHGNITGTFKAAYLKGNGMGVTGLNANNLAVGTIPGERIPSNIVRNDAFTEFTNYVTVKAHSIQVTDPFSNQLLYLGYGTSEGQMITYGASHKNMDSMSSLANYPSNGYINVYDSLGSNQAGMYVGSDNKGHIFADVKNFRVPDPLNDAQDIVYACVEGPEAAAYIRGTASLVNGHARVELPQHFSSITDSQGLTVQVTPGSRISEGLAVENRTNTGFDIYELHNGKGAYSVDWEVKAVRAGHEDYRPVRAWDEALPATRNNRQQLWNARVASIQADRARRATKTGP